MPFCPECKYEYVPGITTCPDCGRKLVAKLHEKREEQPEYEWVDLVTVANYFNIVDAQMAKLKLDLAGINSSISGENLARVTELVPLSLGGVGVLVRPEDAERAREVLASKD